VLGDSALRSGSHTLTIALSEPGRDDVVTTQIQFDVPVAPKEGVFLQGPILARVVDDGKLIRELLEQPDADRPFDELLADQETIELLLINEVEATDSLIAFWQACAAGKQLASRSKISIERRILTEAGEPVRVLDRHPFRPDGDGRTRCDGALDPIPAGSLEPGKYVIELVAIDEESGSELARETAPISLR
jgi:hypothetical protein